MSFQYQAEKFSTARKLLMIPHPNGEIKSIVDVFHECSLGLHHLDEEHLDDTAKDWLGKLKELMNTDDLSDPDGSGLWAIKAEMFTEDQKFELSEVVDGLAYWFDRNN
jgi:hypothetical protein